MSVIKMILFSPEKLKLRRTSSAWLLSLIHEFSDLTMGAMTLSLCLVVGYIENKLQLIR